MSEAFTGEIPVFKTKEKPVDKVRNKIENILKQLRSRATSSMKSQTADTFVLDSSESSTHVPGKTTDSFNTEGDHTIELDTTIPAPAESFTPPHPEVPETILSTQQATEESTPENSEFPSSITEKYFQDWESLNLDANPEIKARMRFNIVESEKRHQESYEKAAKHYGVTLEEFKSKLQEKIEEAISESDFFIATKVETLDRVLGEGERYKTQFETNKTGAQLNPKLRALAELLLFAFNEPEGFDYSSIREGGDVPKEVIDTNREKRPVYGYFSNDDMGAINGEGENPPPNHVTQYGEIVVKIKKDKAMRKATVTFQDSLHPANEWPATPACKPHFTSLAIEGHEDDSILEEVTNTSRTKWLSLYTEAQFHGQLGIDDIEAIYISTKNGLNDEEIETVRSIFNKFKEAHPESTIKLIEF